MKRNDFKQPLGGIGERVMHYKPGIKGRDKLDNRWNSGMWLGMRDESHEVIIGTPLGCIKVRDVKRYASEDDQWDVDRLNAFRGVPWEPTPGSRACELKVKIDVPRLQEDIGERLMGEERPYIARRFRVKPENVKAIGWTPLCPGCRAIIRGLPAQGHSEICRSRVEEYLLTKG